MIDSHRSNLLAEQILYYTVDTHHRSLSLSLSLYTLPKSNIQYHAHYPNPNAGEFCNGLNSGTHVYFCDPNGAMSFIMDALKKVAEEEHGFGF